jgi:hypothetical protein
MKIYNGNKRQVDMSAKPEKYPQGRFKEKTCKRCGDNFWPMAPSHHYCSQTCADDAHTDKYYTKKYGVTVDFVRDLFSKQEGVCAICKKPGFKMLDTHMSGVNLDHCHKTGKVRGLLCHNCNRGLGLFQDNVDYLQSAVYYLRASLV